MPHVRMLFVDEPPMREFLRANKGTIAGIVADVLGYPRDEVAVIPNPIKQDDMELADNVLPLEIVIDSGTRWVNRADEVPHQIRQRILDECDGAKQINFGVWPRSFQGGFAEHKP